MRQYVFGPVPSRRLGISLGIDITPGKTCSFDCIYCQLSKTRFHTAQRAELCSCEKVLHELEEVLGEIAPPDWLTFSGTGEPTLHSGIGYIISELKRFSPSPVCVITNASLLWLEEVQTDLLMVDRLLPTVTTVKNDTFAQIHRPVKGLKLEKILIGLKEFSEQFSGNIEVEVFVLPGINDSPAEISGLHEYLSSLKNLSAVYLNTSVRMPLESRVLTADHVRLDEFRQQLKLDVPVTTAFEHTEVPPRPARWSRGTTTSDVLTLLLRHPCSLLQLEKALGTKKDVIEKILQTLSVQGKIHLQQNGEWRLIDEDSLFR